MLITRRHGSWVVLGTLVTAAELEPTPPLDAGLRLVHALHRRLPDRRARRAGRARRDAVPLLLDAGARADPGALPGRRSAPRSTAATSARTSARGTAASSGGAPAAEPDRGRARRPARLARRRRRGSTTTCSRGSTSPATTRAGCGGTRSSRSATPASRRPGDARARSSAHADGDDELLAEHARWALEPAGGADAAERPRALDLARPPDRVPVRPRRGRRGRATRPGWETWAWVTTGAFAARLGRASSCSRASSSAPRHPFAQSLAAQIFDTAIVTGVRDGLRLRARPAGAADPLHRPRRGLRPVRDPRRPRRSPPSRRRSSRSSTKLRADQLDIAFSWKLVALPDRARGADGADRRLARPAARGGGRTAEARAEEAERLHEAERRTVAELRRLSALRADFVSLVSHEVRTPMAAVIGSARTLQQRWRDLTTEQRDAFLALIADETDRLAALVGEVLDTSRIDAGHVQLHVRRARSRRAHQRDGRHRRARPRVASRIASRVPPRSAGRPRRPARLRQVLTNLIDNAVKYSPEGSPVEVRARAVNGHATIEVVDRGSGIAPEDQRADLREVRPRPRHLVQARHGSRPLHRARDRRGARRHARGQLDARARARRSRLDAAAREARRLGAAPRRPRRRRGASRKRRSSSRARVATSARSSGGSSTTASPRNESTSPTSQSALPTGRSESAAPSTSGRAPFSTSQRPTVGRVPDAGGRRLRAAPSGSKPSRGSELAS